MKKLYTAILCLILGLTTSYAQISVRGIVQDEEGKSIAGAAVVVKGTIIGKTTGSDGRFAIDVPNDNSTLVVSFLGYTTEEIKARPNMTIVLSTSDTMLGDIVVTGMTRTDRRMFSGVADKLNADEVRLGGMPDISRSLEGRSAGVSVQNVSGTFGTAPKIRIRGATSIYGASKPLWVVDGVILEDVTEIGADDLSSGDAITMISSAIAGLNPDDIESFDILKDGSATSIYGARAMAGVIVVTTKKGRPGTASMTYMGEFTTRMKPSYRTFNIMNSQDQMGVYQELEEKGWLNFGSTYRAADSGVYGKMYQLINTYDPITGEPALANTIEGRNAYLKQAEMRNTDWFDHLFSNSMMMNHSVSISSGTEKSASRVSLSAMNDPGWSKASSVERYTLNANSSYRILPNLQLIMHGSGSYRNQTAPGTVSAGTDPVYGTVSREFDINPYSYALNTSRTMSPNEDYSRNYTGFNILKELEQNQININIAEFRGQAELKWGIIDGLDVSVLGAIRYQSTTQQHQIKDDSNQSRAYREMSDATIRNANRYLYKDPDVANSLPVTILPEGGFYEKREYRMLSYDFRAAASYNKTFAEMHSVSAYGGVEINQAERMNDWFRGWGMQYENGEKAFFDYLAFKKAREANSDYFTLNNTIKKLASFFATATYSYDMRYSVTGTFRYEGTNRLGMARSARWLPTWNVSGMWTVHNEKFFESLRSTFSHLTLRASYSLTADAGPEYVTNSHAVIGSSTPWRPSAGVSEPGISVLTLENRDLTYEKKNEFNVGLNMGFLQNRINVEVDYYNRKNKDLIGIVTTQGVGGEITKLGNSAKMKSYGVELSISSNNMRRKSSFSWDTNFIFSYNKNEITDLVANSRIIDLLVPEGGARQGFPQRGLFSIKFNGLDEEGFPIFQLGDKIYDKYNYGDLNLQLSSQDALNNLYYEGPAEPRYHLSLGNVFHYKGIRLNLFITSTFGGKVRLDEYFSSSYNDHMAMPKEFKNRWMMTGDEKKTDIPVIANTRQVRKYSDLRKGYNLYNMSSARVAKSDFIRMKEISVSYDLPKSLTKNWAVKDISFKVQATNPFLIYSDSKLNGQDPEFFSSGGVALPVPQQFTFTIRLGF